MEFDIEKARELIRNQDNYIKNFYPQLHLKAYKKYNISEIFEPFRWVKSEETILTDVARLVRLAYDEANNGNIAFESINCIMSYFRNYCIMERGMLFREIEKEEAILIQLIHGEYDSLDAEFTQTTRLFLEIWLDIILDKQKAIERYEREKESVWELIWSARYINEPPVNEYLISRLHTEDRTRRIRNLIEALGENRVEQAIDTIKRQVADHISEDSSLVYSTIDYCRNVQSFDSVELLRWIESEYKKKHLDCEKYNIDLEVAYCKQEKGEKGLIDLFHNTSDYHMRCDIIHLYKYYHTKEFAAMLVDALSDPYQLENGRHPVQYCACSELHKESFLKLMEWFGYDIMDRVCKMMNSF